MSGDSDQINLANATPAGDAFPLGPEISARPFVVAVMGLPGAGKSVVARAIEDQLQLRRVCRDQIRAAMFPRCNYSFIEKRAAYKGVLLALEINCMLRVGSVIDGMTFSRAADLDRVDTLARRYDARAVPIWLDVPPHVARERIARDLTRGAHPAADRNPELVAQVARRFEAPPSTVAAIDSSLPVDTVREQAFAIVRAALAAPR